MKKLLLLAIVVLGISAVSFGQINPTVSTTADASANLVSPILISKTNDLVFGNVAVSATTGGTVVMAPTGTRTNTNGVSLPATTGTFNAASFLVTGQEDYAFTFVVTTASMLVKNGGAQMLIDGFTHNSTGILDGGSQTVNVGATLHVSANQATGLYESETPFTVTVNYN